MKSPVYFISTKETDTLEELAGKTRRLIDKSRVLSCLKPQDSAAVKLHFGEEGNTGFVRPALLRAIVDEIKKLQAKPFLSDTNTLYKGRRTNSADHLKLAQEHGFTQDIIDAPVLIPDDTQASNIKTIALNAQFVKTAKIAALYAKADALVGVAHFKGHLMTGFGGALKNIGMGCASREGKLAQHSGAAPFVIEKKCIGCEACVAVCPVQAISMRAEKAVIDEKTCIGCASCLAACESGAIMIDWEAGGKFIQEKMAEYAKAVLDTKRGKQAFLNFCVKITQECDCLAEDDPRIVPDIGICASCDPVALDQACLDLVKKSAGEDIFQKLHPKRDGAKQLRHAQALGLGTTDYELITV